MCLSITDGILTWVLGDFPACTYQNHWRWYIVLELPPLMEEPDVHEIHSLSKASVEEQKSMLSAREVSRWKWNWEVSWNLQCIKYSFLQFWSRWNRADGGSSGLFHPKFEEKCEFSNWEALLHGKIRLHRAQEHVNWVTGGDDSLLRAVQGWETAWQAELSQLVRQSALNNVCMFDHQHREKNSRWSW